MNNTANQELAPCPFCNAKMIMVDEITYYHPDGGTCPVRVLAGTRAIHGWNTRSHPTPDREVMSKALEALREAYDRMSHGLTKKNMGDPLLIKTLAAITALEAALGPKEEK